MTGALSPREIAALEGLDWDGVLGQIEQANFDARQAGIPLPAFRANFILLVPIAPGAERIAPREDDDTDFEEFAELGRRLSARYGVPQFIDMQEPQFRSDQAARAAARRRLIIALRVFLIAFVAVELVMTCWMFAEPLARLIMSLMKAAL